MPYPNERAEAEEAESMARAALADEGFAAAFAKTEHLTLDEAIDYALGVE
jgi:hypothetical protein